MVKLNLGSGRRPLPGFVNIDNQPVARPDVLHDLEIFPWPFEDAEAEEVVASHVLEHIHDMLGVMKELYRVMAPDTLLRIYVPHHLSDGFFGDPTHVRPITLAQLELFSRRKCEEFRAKDWPNTPLAEYLGVDFEVTDISFDLMPAWAAKGLDKRTLDFAMTHYFNVINEVRFVLRRMP
jgi:SAM-dependent methyltransferase